MRSNKSVHRSTEKEGKIMFVRRAKRFVLVIVASLAAGAFGASLPGCDNPRERAQDAQRTDPDKERVIQGREELHEKKTDLRGAVKEGENEAEIERRQKEIKEKKQEIVQDKKQIREEQLESAKAQNEAKQGAQSGADAK
jgi:hypothetical protein